MTAAAAEEDPRVLCYGRDCWKCASPCELFAAGLDRCREEMDDRRISRTGILHDTEYWGEVPDVTATDDATADVEPGMDARREIQLEIVRRMADMYFNRPASFDLMMRRAYFGDNQSALARYRGTTRQAVSKAIKKERDDKLRAENTALRNMTETERTVYRLAAEDGVLSVSEIARQSGLSRWTIWRVQRIFRLKYGIVLHFQRPSRKKIEKNHQRGAGGLWGGVGI